MIPNFKNVANFYYSRTLSRSQLELLNVLLNRLLMVPRSLGSAICTFSFESILLLFASFFFSFEAANAMSAVEIMTKNEETRRVSDVTASAKLVTGGGGSTERVKKFTWWRKLISDGVHFDTLTRFHFPPEVKGEGILFLEHVGDQADVQMYLPNFKKIRRVESQQQSGSFMGSEFSYADIASPHVPDYKYKLLREETCVEGDQKNLKCYVIESIPATDAVKERTGTARSVHWIRQDNFMGLKSECYNDKDELHKTMDISQNKEVDSVAHKWMALRVQMTNTNSKHYTVLEFEDVKVNQKISDNIFTPQNLARDR